MVKLLLDSDASIHAKDDNALHSSQGMDISKWSDYCWTEGVDAGVNCRCSMYFSVFNWHLDAAMRLLAHGADLEAGIGRPGTPETSKFLTAEPDQTVTRRDWHSPPKCQLRAGQMTGSECNSMAYMLCDLGFVCLPDICISATMPRPSIATPHFSSSLMKTRKNIGTEHEWLKCGLVGSSMRGDVNRVNVLLDSGADIHAQEDYALRWAAKRGHLEVVKLLLDRGAGIHAQNDDSLRWAAWHGHLEVVKLLLDRGADIHAEYDHAFRWAAERGHFEVVKMLLDRGADIRAQSDYALRIASFNGNVDLVRMLIDRGADAFAQGNFALRKSVVNGHDDVSMLLVAVGADLDVGISAAKDARNSRMICFLDQIKISREEKLALAAEVPPPERSAGMIRM